MQLYYKALSQQFLRNPQFDTSQINYSRSMQMPHEELCSHFENLLKGSPNQPVSEVFLESDIASLQFPWELVYEIVRKDDFPEHPRRLDSYFVFNDIGNAEVWAKRRSDYIVCKVEVLEHWDSFTGDMHFLDCVEIDSSFQEIQESVQHYWSGTISFNPILETILQGKLRLLPQNM